MMRKRQTIIFFIGTLLSLAACKKLVPKAGPDNESLDGTIDGLTFEQKKVFLAGDAIFNSEGFTTQKGLGPIFIATACRGCHNGDGKGHPSTLVTRFGQSDSTGNQYLNLGGPQLQNRAIPGYMPEQIPSGAPSVKLLAPVNTGLGFLDALTDLQILANADPNDADNDSISGELQWVNLKPYVTLRAGSLTQNGKVIGRFGKKAGEYDLLEQVCIAFNQDIGITSSFEPKDPFTQKNADAEISDKEINDVVFYLKTLKAPQQRNTGNIDVIAGKNLFISIGCGKCHIPEWTTPQNPIAGLSNKTFYPYTDLLLHDMGPALDDGYTEGTALSSEWRTPPLWGLGLAKNSQGGNLYLLHDGRAPSIEAAIAFHGGEAQSKRDAYNALSETQKKQVIAFLESL